MAMERDEEFLDISVWHEKGNAYLKMLHSKQSGVVSFSISPENALKLAISHALQGKAIAAERNISEAN